MHCEIIQQKSALRISGAQLAKKGLELVSVDRTVYQVLSNDPPSVVNGCCDRYGLEAELVLSNSEGTRGGTVPNLGDHLIRREDRFVHAD